jgi:hypothetical protein
MVPGSPHPDAHAHPAAPSGPGYAARLADELFGGSTREDSSPARDLLHAVKTSSSPFKTAPPSSLALLAMRAVRVAVTMP